MNKDRRKRLQEALDLLTQAQSLIEQAAGIVEEVNDEEQEAFENMPESLHNGERGEQMQAAIDALGNVELDGVLEDAISSIEEVIDA